MGQTDKFMHRISTMALMVLLLMMSQTVMSVPARLGMWRTIMLADGTQVRAELRGDEYCRFYRSHDGRLFVQDEENTTLYKELKESELINKAFLARKKAFSIDQESLSLDTEQPVSKLRKISMGGAHSPFVGQKRCLCILVNFSDVKFKEENTLEAFQNLINKKGYTNEALGHVGSVRDYFYDQSEGLLDIEFDVVGPYDLPYKQIYYGQNVGGGDRQVPSMIRSAVQKADAAGADFTQYDWDGDGVCEAIYVVYAGMGESDGGSEDTVWPQKGTLTNVFYDGMKISDFACGSELNGDGVIDGIGTMCHEYSHCLGFPDMYDTNYSGNYGTGSWDIMCAGSYNGGGNIPPAYNAYERWYAGWKEPVELTTDCEVTGMKPLTSGGEFYIIRNDNCADEYYLLENRQKEGWDSALGGSGMLIYHVDFSSKAWANNIVNTTNKNTSITSHERFALFLADNDKTATLSTEALNDAYPYLTNNSLTDTSVPAATLYNANNDGSLLMHKPVTDISMTADGLVSFRFQNLNTSSPDPDGIINVSTEDANDETKIYNLSGQRVTADTKGILIYKGKKILK